MNRKEFITGLSATIAAFAISGNLEAKLITLSTDEFKAGIEKILRRHCYEGNNAKTRDNIRADILKYISDYCDKKNLTTIAYDVVCDTSNNSLESIEQNKINVDIAYKTSVNDIEFKVLKCTVCPSAAEF